MDPLEIGDEIHPELPKVRLAIVDDTDDVRLLLRLAFGSDPRFDLVGEGENGEDAIDLAVREKPDLMILDRHMPVLGGIEAIPAILAGSPRTAVVLYTAGADAATCHAALSAGAVEVVDKASVDGFVVERITDILVEHRAFHLLSSRNTGRG